MVEHLHSKSEVSDRNPGLGVHISFKTVLHFFTNNNIKPLSGGIFEQKYDHCVVYS